MAELIQSKTERDMSIDVARGIALLLMVIGHLGIRKWPIQYIYAFHMPLFFVLSGMTIRRSEKFSEYLLKRAKRLLVPYILLAAIYSLPGARNWGLVLYGSRGGLAAASSLTPLWFLPALFIADIVFQMMLQICGGGGTAVNTIVLMVFSVLFGIVGNILSHLKIISIGLPFGIEIAFIALPFVAAGYLAKKSYQSYKTTNKVVVSAVLMCVPLLLYHYNLPVSVTEGFAHVEMSIGSCGNYALFYLNALAGSLGIVLFSSAISRFVFLQKLGRCTLACLGTHGFIVSSVYTVANKCNIPFMAAGFMAFILVLFLTYPIQKVAEKFIPNLVGK